MRHAHPHPVNPFPWGRQALCLAPSIVMLGVLAFGTGTGDTLTLFFKTAQESLPRVVFFMDLVSDQMSHLFYLIYALLLFKGILDKNKKLIIFVGAVLLAQVCISLILVNLVKFLVGSPRPLPALGGASFMPFSFDDSFQSFPSGHTTHITALASPLILMRPDKLQAFILGLAIALVAFSRIFLSKHHLVDIAGGMLFGLAAVLLVHHLCSRDVP